MMHVVEVTSFTGKELYDSRRPHKGVPRSSWGDLYPAYMGQWETRARLMSRRSIRRLRLRLRLRLWAGDFTWGLNARYRVGPYA